MPSTYKLRAAMDDDYDFLYELHVASVDHRLRPLGGGMMPFKQNIFALGGIPQFGKLSALMASISARLN